MSEKILFKVKNPKLHIDEKIYKKVRSQVQQNLIKKKRNFYEINFEQKINKLKEVWKTLKSMGLPSKGASALNNCSKDENEIQKIAPFSNASPFSKI